MAVTIKQVEAIPAEYPNVTPYAHTNRDSFDEDAAIDPALIWQRLESWIAHRWGERQVVWMVEGEDEWTPPLTPATLVSAEKWEGTAWVPVTTIEGPYGYCFIGDGPYRVTATVGASDAPPEAVQEAFRRLHEYSRGVAEQWRNEAASYRGRDGEQAVAGHSAKSIHLSGAADLLRNYRRA